MQFRAMSYASRQCAVQILWEVEFSVVIGNAELMHKCWTIEHGNYKYETKLLVLLQIFVE